ncbi:MAG: hypothetical protein QM744_04315 [Mesorhizobium sp.]
MILEVEQRPLHEGLHRADRLVDPRGELAGRDLHVDEEGGEEIVRLGEAFEIEQQRLTSASRCLPRRTSRSGGATVSHSSSVCRAFAACTISADRDSAAVVDDIAADGGLV